GRSSEAQSLSQWEAARSHPEGVSAARALHAPAGGRAPPDRAPREGLGYAVRPRKQRGGRARGEPAPQAKRRGGRGGDPHRARGGVPVGDTGSGGLVKPALKISSSCLHVARARPVANCSLQTEFPTSDQEQLCHATSGRSLSSSAR